MRDFERPKRWVEEGGAKKGGAEKVQLEAKEGEAEE